MAINLDSKTTKRQKVAISSVVYALAFLGVILGDVGVWGALVLVAVSFAAVIYSLDMDLKHEEWLIYPLYPILATISLYTWVNQYVAIDTIWLIGGALLVGWAMYGMLLALNILNISTVRVLPLARTAKSVMSMAGVVISFSIYQLIAIGQPEITSWTLAIGGASFLAAWPLIWTTISGKKKLMRSVGWTFLATIVQMQLALFVGWWPITFMSSLFLAMSVFITLGIIYFQEQKQISGAEKRQYLILAVGLLVAFVMSVQW